MEIHLAALFPDGRCWHGTSEEKYRPQEYSSGVQLQGFRRQTRLQSFARRVPFPLTITNCTVRLCFCSGVSLSCVHQARACVRAALRPVEEARPVKRGSSPCPFSKTNGGGFPHIIREGCSGQTGPALVLVRGSAPQHSPWLLVPHHLFPRNSHITCAPSSHYTLCAVQCCRSPAAAHRPPAAGRHQGIALLPPKTAHCCEQSKTNPPSPVPTLADVD